MEPRPVPPDVPPPSAGSVSDVFPALQSAGILSVVVFLINVAYEVFVIHDLYETQLFLIAILHWSLSAWALAEVLVTRRRGSGIPLRTLTLALIAQLALGVVRHIGDFSPGLDALRALPLPAGADLASPAVFGSMQLLIFLVISKSLIDAFSWAERQHARDLEVQIGIVERTRQWLRESEERYRLMAEQLDDLIWTTNVAGRFTYMSRSAQALLGWAPEEMNGREFPEFLATKSPEIMSEVFVRLRHLAEAGVSAPRHRGEVELRRKDGSSVWAEVTVNVLYDANGRFAGFTGIARDVSERRRREAELERHRCHLEELVGERTVALGEALFASQSAERVKDALLRNASHELRTPLNQIMGGADLLLRGSHDEKQDKWLKTIHASSRDMLGLVNELLDVARLEGGEVKLESREFSPAAVLEQVRVALAPRAEKKGIALQVAAVGDLPARVVGDATRLAQALLNYVDNAIKFTEKGSVTLSARTIQQDSQGVQLQFEVLDTGIGIAPEEQEKLFKAFVQLDATTTRRHGGLGIGLANVAQLAKLMGAKVGVSSTAEQGSIFWLLAPFQLPA